MLQQRFGHEGMLHSQLPLFPDEAGKPVQKEAIVRMVEVMASTLGYPLVAPNGRPAFGGHVFRISGARHLAAAGVEISVIMLLVRWGSNIVMHHIKDASFRQHHQSVSGLKLAWTTFRRSSNQQRQRALFRPSRI